jgi:hypothetical protein
MSANLITGNLFSPILASQDSDYQAGVSGDKTLILPVGAKMSLEIEDANTIRANDGVLVTKEGRRVQIDTGAVEEWSIPTGTQGETSYYLIGFHLYTTEESAEICETFIEKVASATDTITENTFKGGATEVYITLGRVTQDGINLDSVEGLIDTADSLTDLGAKITQINADLTELKTHSATIIGTKTSAGANANFRLAQPLSNFTKLGISTSTPRFTYEIDIEFLKIQDANVAFVSPSAPVDYSRTAQIGYVDDETLNIKTDTVRGWAYDSLILVGIK